MMPMLNWVYGARTPELSSMVEEAIYAAHRYRNKLCELERAKRDRHYELLRQLAPAYLEAEAAHAKIQEELGQVRKEIQAEKAKQRTTRPKGVQTLTARAAELKAESKQAYERLKAAKQQSYEDPAVQAAMAANQEQYKREAAAAKEASGLYWGTEAIVKQACSSFASGSPPKFKKYDGQGQIAVQLQGGMDTKDARHRNTLCYFEPLSERRAYCYFRIGSEQRRPVFSRVTVVMHRPLPEGLIKWAYLERRRIADHVRWSLRLTIDVPLRNQARDRTTYAAVHCGWHMESSGLRVALWQGSDGKRGVLRLDEKHLADYLRLDDLSSRRKQLFNEMLEKLRAFCKERQESLPEFLAEVAPHLHSWESPAKLAALILRWRAQRFEGDELFTELDRLRKEEKHLWQHDRRLAVRVVRRRNNLYRVFARRLADTYGVLYFASVPVKILTENPNPEDLERDPNVMHRRSRQAAVSTLVQYLKEKFPLHALEVDSFNLSKSCHHCGHVTDSDSRKVQCRECGKTWDVDENALANTISRGQELQSGGGLLKLVEAYEAAGQEKQAKLAKMQNARRQSMQKRKENIQS